MTSDSSNNSLVAGQYTDDTQMSITVAKTLLSSNLSKESFAKSFVETFHMNPRKGYAMGFYQFLLSYSTASSFLNNIRPDSVKNGAAMRSVPLGVLSTTQEVMNIADIQASVTHDNQYGKDSSKIIGLASYYMLRNSSKEGLIPFIEKLVPGYNLSQVWNKPVP